jgi:hypothetical protein
MRIVSAGFQISNLKFEIREPPAKFHPLAEGMILKTFAECVLDNRKSSDHGNHVPPDYFPNQGA